MYSILSLSRIFIYVISIILLISSIKTKNKSVCKNNLIASLFFIIYFYMSIYALPGYFEIDTGLEVLFYLLTAGIDSIVLIIGIIIDIVKLKKKEMKDTNNTFLKFYWIILIVIPIIMALAGYFYEINILNNCNLVLTFNYQNGIVISENTKVAINETSCKEISIGESFKRESGKNVDFYYYNVEENESGEIVVTSEYDDPSLSEIDIKIVEEIYKADNYEKNKTALKLYDDEPNAVHKAIVIKIKGTDYYIVDYLISREASIGGGTGLGSAIFYGSDFIDNLNVSGDLDSAYCYSK